MKNVTPIEVNANLLAIENELPEYTDAKGLIHHQKNTISENGPIFTLRYYLRKYFYLRKLNPKTNTDPLIVLRSDFGRIEEAIFNTAHRIDLENGTFLDNFTADGTDRTGRSHFSHDNMSGEYGLNILTEQTETVKDLPISYWNGKWHLHPRDILFYLILKFNYLVVKRPVDYFKLLAPSHLLLIIFTVFALEVFALMARISALAAPVHSSGKFLWDDRLLLLTVKWRNNPILLAYVKLIRKGFHWILKVNHKVDYPMYEVSDIYFKEEHPTTRLISLLGE